MTVICAITDGKTCTIGSDTQASDNNGVISDVGPKWICWGGWGVGVAGHLRVTNICAAHAKTLFDDLGGAWEFSNRLRDLFEQYSIKPDEQGPGAQLFGSRFILASPTAIFDVYQDISITELPQDELWAAGSGGEIALGVGYAMRGQKQKMIVEKATRAAIEYTTGCGGDVWLDTLS